jgi:endonuclease-3
MKEASKEDINFIKQQFIKYYSGATTELNYKNDFELLVAIILSAQCTDKRVNIITPILFEKYPTIQQLANAKLGDVKEILKTCSFFNNKSKNIIQMAITLLNNFNGKIPYNAKQLTTLAGVGNKTANVFLIETQKANLMAVDTHVFRVSHRLGLSNAKTIKQTQKQLTSKLKYDLNIFHQAMVLFGRYICKAVKPECKKCFLSEVCKTKQSKF